MWASYLVADTQGRPVSLFVHGYPLIFTFSNLHIFAGLTIPPVSMKVPSQRGSAEEEPAIFICELLQKHADGVCGGGQPLACLSGNVFFTQNFTKY